MTLAAGTRLGPYEIVSLIGAGGMGQVYRARDMRLGRDVAIKVSDERFSDRFSREAHSIAALNHPNICTLHDVGPNYLVMESIEGATLAERIEQRSIRDSEIYDIAEQIAAALEEAHRKGVLHRDLKPGNIMLVERHGGADRPTVKVLDFGLAKVADSDPDATRTITGTVMGTPAYMAPEQVEGRPLDERSEVFSFGALLYELLSGRRAFSGKGVADVLNAVVRAEPPAANSPPALDRVLRRCLQKDPAQRFQTMADVRRALSSARGVSPARLSGTQPAIAVLPFADMSAGRDHEWFSDGLSEEIINALVHVPGLTVIARTSAFAFKGKQEDIRRIADMLGVTHVLEGSVRRAGDCVRVMAQLITATSGAHLWSERYDRDMADVFAIQDDIALAIATTLQARLVRPLPVRQYEPKLPAYEALLKSRHYFSKSTPDSLARSMECLQEAIALDPGFGLAHYALAANYLVLTTGMGTVPARKAMPIVRADRTTGIRARPVAGRCALVVGRRCRCLRLRMARSGTPVPSGDVHATYGFFYLRSVGRSGEAATHISRWVHEDPLNLIARISLAMSLAESGALDDALKELAQVLELDANHPAALTTQAQIYARQGRDAEAHRSVERAYVPRVPQSVGALAAMLVRNGDSARARSVLQPLMDAPDAYGAPRGLFVFHALTGDLDRAGEWLEKAIHQRDPAAPSLAQHHIGSGARWPTLAKMMNLP